MFVVHCGVAAVRAPPTIRATFSAADYGSPDGMWTLDPVRRALRPLAAAGSGPAGFACEDTLTLAAETIGFGGSGTGPPGAPA